MALGNGAPDVLTAIIGSDNDSDDGFLFPVGSLYGAGIFCSCIVLALVIKNSTTAIKG